MSTGERRSVAYVLPVYDEAAGVADFHAALVAATEQRPDLDFEFVYVDDGSRDESLAALLELRGADERVAVISLSRNFGHQLAVTAGLDAPGRLVQAGVGVRLLLGPRAAGVVGDPAQRR